MGELSPDGSKLQRLYAAGRAEYVPEVSPGIAALAPSWQAKSISRKPVLIGDHAINCSGKANTPSTGKRGCDDRHYAERT